MWSWCTLAVVLIQVSYGRAFCLQWMLLADMDVGRRVLVIRGLIATADGGENNRSHVLQGYRHGHAETLSHYQ